MQRESLVGYLVGITTSDVCAAGGGRQKGTQKEILVGLPSSDYWQASFGYYLKQTPIVLATW